MPAATAAAWEFMGAALGGRSVRALGSYATRGGLGTRVGNVGEWFLGGRARSRGFSQAGIAATRIGAGVGALGAGAMLGGYGAGFARRHPYATAGVGVGVGGGLYAGYRGWLGPGMRRVSGGLANAAYGVGAVPMGRMGRFFGRGGARAGAGVRATSTVAGDVGAGVRATSTVGRGPDVVSQGMSRYFTRLGMPEFAGRTGETFGAMGRGGLGPVWARTYGAGSARGAEANVRRLLGY